jgi:hypothetical protein
MKLQLRSLLISGSALVLAGSIAWAANNYRLPTSGGTTTTFKSTDNSGVHTPHVNVDSIPAATPSADATLGIAPVNNTVVANGLVLKATPGNLYSLGVKIGATTGNVILIDAAAIPSNGGVVYKWCKPVLSNGTLGGDDWKWDPPASFATGIVALFSTDTSCAVFTGSATAQFSGQPK